MRRTERWRGRHGFAASSAAMGIALLSCAACTPWCVAQTLTFGNPEEPRLGDQAAAVVLASQLRAEADAIAETGAASRVRAWSRRLAAAMLESGERDGRRGATRSLLGRTLAGRASVIDDVIAKGIDAGGAGGAGPLDDATLAVVASDLERLARGVGGVSVESLEQEVRIALAPLLDAWEAQNTDPGREPAPLGGWVTTDEPPDVGAYRALVSRLTSDGTPLSGAAVDAVQAIDALAESAVASRAFRRSGESIRLAMLEAGPAAEPPPRWLTPPAIATMQPSLERALGNLADPSRRGQGLEELRRVGRLMRLIGQTGRLSDDQAGRRAREALASYMAAPPSNRELEAQVLSAYERGLAMALAPADLPDERRLLRQLRPSWREFQDAARVAANRVADVLPTLLNDSQAMTDPGVLALFNAARQTMIEARGMLDLTVLVAGREDIPPGAEPTPLDQYRDLATRLLAISQAASRDGGEGDAARRALGTLATDAASWRVMAGEGGLRVAVATPDPAWTAATERRERDLLDLIDRTRGAYLANVASDGTLVERAALRARLAMLADLLALVEQVVASVRLMDAGGGAAGSEQGDPMSAGAPQAARAGLGEWSGWELSRQSQQLLSEGLIDALAETVSLALRGEDERARIRIAAMRGDLAGALLPGRLALAWERQGVSQVGPLDEIGLGGADPARAWMPVDREILAEFCRAAGELAGVRLRRDDAQDRAVRAYLTMLAQDAMAAAGGR